MNCFKDGGVSINSFVTEFLERRRNFPDGLLLLLVKDDTDIVDIWSGQFSILLDSIYVNASVCYYS